MHSAAEGLWESQNAQAESAYMATQQKRAEPLLAALAAIAGGVDHAISRGTQLRAVVGIAGEVERHANAIDPREVTAVSVLVDLVVDLAGGLRHLANVMIKDDQPAARDYPAESEWPASLMPEVRS